MRRCSVFFYFFFSILNVNTMVEGGRGGGNLCLVQDPVIFCFFNGLHCKVKETKRFIIRREVMRRREEEERWGREGGKGSRVYTMNERTDLFVNTIGPSQRQEKECLAR